MFHRGLCLLLGLTILLGGIACASADGMEGFEFAEKIPSEYYRSPDKNGTTLKIHYESKDYAGDGADVTKYAVVYLPPDYSEDNLYDVLVLCNGIGGSENEWGFMNQNSIRRNMLDNLILNGDIPPMIVVMPNGRSTAKYMNASMGNAASFYAFGQELRNDLLPFIDANFATYGSLTPDDLSASRNHRAMAGLSMGGMQTINIGLCECLDLFSAFGAFSAAPTSYTAVQIAAELNRFPDMPIRYFYSICGLQDGTAYGAASGAAKNLPDYTDRVTEANWHWQELKGGHDFNIWTLGLYNFARVLGALHED